MSKFVVYSSYKDSGVEWLGEVPEYWRKSYLKYISSINMGQSPSSINYNIDGIGMPFLQGNADFGKLHPTARTFTTEIKKTANVEDILFTVRAPVGAMNTADKKYAIGRGLCAITANQNSTQHFLWWLMPVLTTELNTVATGSTYEAVSVEQVNNLTVALPAIDEQTAIANFLDRETAKIDTLITKQERMIELLGEKRSALISHAVTKGLDLHVKMKDSGVEWLGEVPEHWEVKKLKYNLRLQTQKVTIDGHSVIALENIESKLGKYVLTESSYQGEDVEFKVGDILFGKLRPYLAKVYKCNSNGVAFGDLLTYRPTKYFDSSFAFYSLLSEEFIRIVDSSTYGAKMPRASSEFINEMLLATPPLPEQIAIAEHLDTQTAKIDTLIGKARQAIELMKERRTALISAAVTGKIDVREAV